MGVCGTSNYFWKKLPGLMSCRNGTIVAGCISAPTFPWVPHCSQLTTSIYAQQTSASGLPPAISASTPAPPHCPGRFTERCLFPGDLHGTIKCISWWPGGMGKGSKEGKEGQEAEHLTPSQTNPPGLPYPLRDKGRLALSLPEPGHKMRRRTHGTAPPAAAVAAAQLMVSPPVSHSGRAERGE